MLIWLFHSLPSPSSRGSFIPLCLWPLESHHVHMWDCWCFSRLSLLRLVNQPPHHFLWRAQCTGLNKQWDCRKPCHTPFWILKQFVATNRVLTLFFSNHIQVPQETGKVVSYYHLLKSFLQFVMIHTVKGFSVAAEREEVAFLECPWFLNDPANVVYLISAASSFSKA